MHDHKHYRLAILLRCLTTIYQKLPFLPPKQCNVRLHPVSYRHGMIRELSNRWQREEISGQGAGWFKTDSTKYGCSCCAVYGCVLFKKKSRWISCWYGISRRKTAGAESVLFALEIFQHQDGSLARFCKTKSSVVKSKKSHKGALLVSFNHCSR